MCSLAIYAPRYLDFFVPGKKFAKNTACGPDASGSVDTIDAKQRFKRMVQAELHMRTRERHRMETKVKKAGKVALSGVLAATLMVPTAGFVVKGANGTAFAACGFPDDDVIPDVWYNDAIDWAHSQGIIAGYPDGTFGPEDPVTRGQVAVMLCRSAGEDISDEAQWPDNQTGWSDVADNAYYTRAMNWAWENGVFQGYEGKVRPDDNITREEIAAVIVRYAERNLNLNVGTDGMSFPQGTLNAEAITPYAYDSLLWTANMDIMSGVALDDGTHDLAPQMNTTRAMFARVVTSLVRDVAPSAEQRPELELAFVKVSNVTSDSASVRAVDSKGEDVTEYCEFSVDGGNVWTSGGQISGLSPETRYAVAARLRGEVDSSRWVEASFTTSKAEEAPAEDVLARLGVSNVSSTSATVAAYSTTNKDITGLCEFSLDGVSWQDSSTFDNLYPSTSYAVHGRVKATATTAAGVETIVTFETPAAPVEDVEGQVTVQEYKLVSFRLAKAYGTGVMTPFGDGIFDYADDIVGDAYNTAEVQAVNAAIKEYDASMTDPDAPYNDKWDSIYKSENRHGYFLVKSGSHVETYHNQAEKDKLYSYSSPKLTIDKLQETGDQSNDTYYYTMSDGNIIVGRKYAWQYCQKNPGVKITSSTPKSMTIADGVLTTKTPAEMVSAAGGDPTQPWCIAGEKILG